MNQGVWEKVEWKNANMEGVGLHNRVKERICTKKRENLPLIYRREKISEKVHLRIDKKGVYSTGQVTTDYTSILCRKEGWEWYKTISIWTSGW